jgi:4-hydroxy-3-methylbut-2-enyl diphosphate reductase
LRELAENRGVAAYLIDEASQIQDAWLAGRQAIGVTAGASAPEQIVTGVIEKLRQRGAVTVEESQGRTEAVTFSLPGELKKSGQL